MQDFNKFMTGKQVKVEDTLKYKGSTNIVYSVESGSECEDGVSDGEAEGKASQQAWPQKSGKIRTKLEMPQDLSVWTDDHALVGVPKCHRMLDCVQVAYWAWLREHLEPADRKGPVKWFCDVSQSIERMKWGDHLGSFQKDSLWYSFEYDRVLDWEDLGS